MSRKTADDPTRASAIRYYAQCYDYHAEQEQLAVAMGDYESANTHHEAAKIAVAAFKGEADHPDDLLGLMP